MKSIAKLTPNSITVNMSHIPNSHSITECSGIDQPCGDIFEQSCASIDVARVLASSLIDRPGKAAAYRDDCKKFWLKDLWRQDIHKPTAVSSCTMFYFNDNVGRILEQAGVDQPCGDISQQPCASIHVARVLARQLVDGPTKAAAYRDDVKIFWLKDLWRSDIQKPSEDSKCTMFYFTTSERAILEYPKVDQPCGDISDQPCPSIVVARVLAHLLLDRPGKAAAYRDDVKRFWVKDLSKSDIHKPSPMSSCTMFYYA